MEHAIVWAAGFFDGEGSISVRVSKARGTFAMIRVRQVDRRPLELLKQMFGGYIEPPEIRGRSQPCWRWVATHRKAKKALRLMLPYLVVKREHAEKLLAASSLEPLRGSFSMNSQVHA